MTCPDCDTLLTGAGQGQCAFCGTWVDLPTDSETRGFAARVGISLTQPPPTAQRKEPPMTDLEHPDCGPITERGDVQHAHDNSDGRCWHENDVPRTTAAECARFLAHGANSQLDHDMYRNAAAYEGERYSEAIAGARALRAKAARRRCVCSWPTPQHIAEHR